MGSIRVQCVCGNEGVHGIFLSTRVKKTFLCSSGEPLPVKKVPEYCLEAALYCRRANLEESLPMPEKQYRVK